MKNYIHFALVFQSIIIIILSSFIVPITISSDTGDRATWSSAITSFFTIITTAVIGFYAYKIANEQNKTSQIAYMAEILRGLADRCNEASRAAQKENLASGSSLNKPQIEQALSELVTPAIKAKEIITKMHPADFDMYKIMFYSMINSSVSTEIMGKQILLHYSLPQFQKINQQYGDAKCMVEPPAE